MKGMPRFGKLRRAFSLLRILGAEIGAGSQCLAASVLSVNYSSAMFALMKGMNYYKLANFINNFK